jgi:hypothetical protein
MKVSPFIQANQKTLEDSMAIFNSTLFFIIFQLLFVISVARAEPPNLATWNFTPGGEVTLCDGDEAGFNEEDGPIRLAQTQQGHCVCGGVAAPIQMVHGGNRIDGGNMFCSPGSGWTKLYPMESLEECPGRVNRYDPPPDGCGSASSGTGWVPQTFLGIVAIDHFVCNPHDKKYSHCGTTKQQADDDWRRDSQDICGLYFPGGGVLYTGCIRQTNLYHTAFVIGGGQSWHEAQMAACQCGPYAPCMGGQARGCINCPPMQQGYFFPVLPLSFPPTGGCSPGDDFC